MAKKEVFTPQAGHNIDLLLSTLLIDRVPVFTPGYMSNNLSIFSNGRALLSPNCTSNTGSSLLLLIMQSVLINSLRFPFLVFQKSREYDTVAVH